MELVLLQKHVYSLVGDLKNFSFSLSVSVCLQDLEYLCEGLEGRSSNPVAVLFDALLLPDSDFGLDRASPLAWRYEPERAIPHLVLGKGPPGGAWHVRSCNY